MQKTMFRLLIVQKEALAAAMASAFQNGESANPLMLTVEENLYDTFDVPSDMQSVNAIYHNYGKAPVSKGGGYAHRQLQAGDIILGSDGKATVIAGEGDFADVTSKISSFVAFPQDPNAVGVAVDPVNEDDEEEDDAGDDDDSDEDVVQAVAKAYPARSIKVGTVANPRNCERSEMQALMTTAIGSAFEANNIPMNRNHSRRAVRAAMRIGIRLAMEEGQNLHSLLSLFSECVSKESNELGKKSGKMSVAMVQFDE